MTPDDLRAKYKNVRIELDLLQDLYEVDWASSAASDVPILLAAAMSEIARDREFAIKLLHENLCHQGTVYEGTALAIPFIARFIQCNDIESQIDFAMLLADISTGTGGFEGGFPTEKDVKAWEPIIAEKGLTFQEVVDEGKKIGNHVREVARKYLNVLFPYIAHGEWFVRLTIARTFAAHPELKEKTIPILSRANQSEHDPRVLEAIRDALTKLQSP
ncbi:MAG: hypothetical protein KDE28_27915 [Anaerolineales bacterium]|nr:hypothetical protein [Anaerolineales bacterium]